MIGKNEVITDDLYVAASTIIIDGTIQGDLLAAGQAVAINGSVRDDARVGGRDDVIVTPWSPGMGMSTPAVPAGLTVGNEAKIGGRLSYTSPQMDRLARLRWSRTVLSARRRQPLPRLPYRRTSA